MKLTKEDKEWAKAVKERDGNKCAVCGTTKLLNAHHILPREIKELRHTLWNGITLCPKHHRFSRELSAHQNPVAFWLWFCGHDFVTASKIIVFVKDNLIKQESE